jgi:hypothetical protein
VQASAVNALQLAAEAYMSTFLADMITFYLSQKIITDCFISVTNLAICHVSWVTIMKKNFQHMKHMSFLLDAFENNSDQKFTKITNQIISDYMLDEDVDELIITQQNKIDVILTIQNFEYVIMLIYHYNILNNINSDKNYNSDNDSNFSSCFSSSESSDNTDDADDSDNDENTLWRLAEEVSDTVNKSRTVNTTIKQIVKINSAVD